MKARTSLIALLIVAVLAAVGVLLFAPVLRLERRNMIFLDSAESELNGQKVIRVSGACADAFLVRRIKTKREGRTVTVWLYASFMNPLGLPRTRASQRFQVDVPVPQVIDQVGFGKEGFVVWQRKAANE